ncbi:MAG: hypothetical protein KF862_14440 [Chitinophagaceae bacterium]|nr:hypothetical protein [Chitinophagaceae bacterium]
MLLLTFPFCRGVVTEASATGHPAVENIQWTIEKSHPWRPPFGLDRVGNSLDVVISRSEGKGNLLKVEMICLHKGREVRRLIIPFSNKKNEAARQNISLDVDEVMLTYKDDRGKRIHLGRRKVPFEMFECEAVVQPATIINPVDMGTILVPADWLLLEQGETSLIRFAAINRQKDTRKFILTAWFTSSPDDKTFLDLTLPSGQKQTVTFTSPVSKQGEKDVLHITLADNAGMQVWKKEVQVMISKRIPTPAFGVVETKLRYDVPILNIVNGRNEPLMYNKAWKDDQSDYIVCLPNGSRWVFWRGASYIPIWASKYNTGLSYEWAERISPNDGFTDCPEPLMDKELRYGKVEVIESTPSRIHVRWSYQSCDFNYKVNGDFAREDYYFYPDGTGTRVLTLTSIPEAEYELAEFILLASQASVPLDIMPDNPLRLISFNNGEKRWVSLPEKDTLWKNLPEPVIYSMKIHRDEPMSAFSFNPLLTQKPFAFAPFYDKGVTVTPAYWGGHWPLNQGFNTGRSINESLWAGPSHNSLVTWGAKRPDPIRSNIVETRDALGAVKKMKLETWTWLIGMTDASEDQLLHTAISYAEPPVLHIRGGRARPETYSSERKALQVIAEDATLNIQIRPVRWTINPVFEISTLHTNITSITLNGKILSQSDYAWDSKTLWLKASLDKPADLKIVFAE